MPPLASVQQVRKAVTDFIPASFAAVGAMVKAYHKAERRCAGGKNAALSGGCRSICR